ncbi:endonuclease domain-containing protein [Microbacterium sp. NPDC056044]|uniref:endonuclease domain-containing protein n=1 Tax=Microbacterium sp. NPDC056044 TaxID=3345690 RepID=UPI0035DC5990
MCSVDQPAVATYRELSAAGMTRARLREEVADGGRRALRRGVYAMDGACADVTVAAAHGGSIACLTAARHAGLWVLETDTTPHVWLRAHGRSYVHDGCRCVTHWDEGTTKDAFGLPTVPRILRQILICRGIEEFFVVLESARRQHLLTASGLKWLRERVGPEARVAINYSRDDADSGLESLLRWRLRSRRLPVRTQMNVVSVGRVDFLIGDRLIVEVDGAPNHDGESHRHKDLVRDAHAASWGYVTLRFDYAMVVHDWPTVELAILGFIDRGLHLV